MVQKTIFTKIECQTFHDVQVLKSSSGSFLNDAKKTSHHRQGHLQDGFNECTSHPIDNCFTH
jgi:hypothetical protein